jgi:hypothetical protein
MFENLKLLQMEGLQESFSNSNMFFSHNFLFQKISWFRLEVCWKPFPKQTYTEQSIAVSEQEAARWGAVFDLAKPLELYLGQGDKNSFLTCIYKRIQS